MLLNDRKWHKSRNNYYAQWQVPGRLPLPLLPSQYHPPLLPLLIVCVKGGYTIITVLNALITARQYWGLVQTITRKVNVIVTLRIYPPHPLPLTSHNELRKVASNAFAMQDLGLISRTQPPTPLTSQ